MLEVSNVDAGYGSTVILQDVSLHVEPGEVVTIVGANGAGKTTLLRTISGLVTPRTGAITFEGRDITKLAAHETVDRGVTLIPEGRQLFPDMTVRDNLLMGAYSRHARDYQDDTLHEVLELFPRQGAVDSEEAVVAPAEAHHAVPVPRALVENRAGARAWRLAVVQQRLRVALALLLAAPVDAAPVLVAALGALVERDDPLAFAFLGRAAEAGPAGRRIVRDRRLARTHLELPVAQEARPRATGCRPSPSRPDRLCLHREDGGLHSGVVIPLLPHAHKAHLLAPDALRPVHVEAHLVLLLKLPVALAGERAQVLRHELPPVPARPDAELLALVQRAGGSHLRPAVRALPSVVAHARAPPEVAEPVRPAIRRAHLGLVLGRRGRKSCKNT